MKTVMNSTLIVLALAVSLEAANPGVRPVNASRNSRTQAAVTASGQTYLAVRDMGVDLDFAEGKSGKGQLYILFEPSTGFFLKIFGWERNDYSRSWIDQREANSRVGVNADSLVSVAFAGGVSILESSEKAGSLEDAEVKSLKWVGDHLGQIETRTDRELYRVTYLPVARSSFPAGFFRSEQFGSMTIVDSAPFLRVKLVDMVHQDGGWDLTLESLDTQRTAKILVFRRGTEWVMGPIRSDRTEK